MVEAASPGGEGCLLLAAAPGWGRGEEGREGVWGGGGGRRLPW